MVEATTVFLIQLFYPSCCSVLTGSYLSHFPTHPVYPSQLSCAFKQKADHTCSQAFIGFHSFRTKTVLTWPGGPASLLTLSYSSLCWGQSSHIISLLSVPTGTLWSSPLPLLWVSISRRILLPDSYLHSQYHLLQSSISFVFTPTVLPISTPCILCSHHHLHLAMIIYFIYWLLY